MPQENEEVAAAFGAAQPEFKPLDVAELLTALKVANSEQLCSGPFLRLWPHRHGTDGFFAAVWERKA